MAEGQSESRSSGRRSRMAINIDERDSERSCWICFASEEDNRLAIWVHPCQCRGTTKWVHQSCLYRWIDEKQKGNPRRNVMCQQCQTEYIIVYPKANRLARSLEAMDYVVRRSSPYVATAMLLGSVYWVAVTYGAITVVQVLGQQRCMELMESSDPMLLFIGLPIIPIGLILSRLIRWEDAVLRIIRSDHNIWRKLRFTNRLANSQANMSVASNEIVPPPPSPIVTEPFYLSRLFCGAILLPSLAVIVGKVFYPNVTNPLHRTLAGGATYIAAKGFLKIYLRQKQYLCRRRRRIVDYTDENIRIYGNGDQRGAPVTGRQDAGLDDRTSDSETIDEDSDTDSKYDDADENIDGVFQMEDANV